MLGLYWLIGPFFYGTFQNLIQSSRNSASKMSHWTVVWPNDWGSKEWCIEHASVHEPHELTSVGLLGCNSAAALQQKVGLSSTPNPPIMNSLKILVLPITGSLKTCLGTSQNESFLQVWHERGVPKNGWWLHGWTCGLQRCYSTSVDFNQRSSESMLPFYGL